MLLQIELFASGVLDFVCTVKPLPISEVEDSLVNSARHCKKIRVLLYK